MHGSENLLLVFFSVLKDNSLGDVVFPSPQLKNQHFSNSSSIRNGRGITTMWICHLYIFTYLFIFIHLFISCDIQRLLSYKKALQICTLLRMYLVLLFTSSVRFVHISSQQ